MCSGGKAYIQVLERDRRKTKSNFVAFHQGLNQNGLQCGASFVTRT